MTLRNMGECTLRKGLVVSCVLLLMLLSPMLARAEIYKCEVKGKVAFSDKPCGDSAKLVKIEPVKKTGTKLSTNAMDKLSDQLHKDRRTRELDHDINKLYKKIERLASEYNKDLKELENQRAELKSETKFSQWNSHPYKRNAYYQKQEEINNDIAETKRRYKTNRRLSYDKLNRLREELRQLR